MLESLFAELCSSPLGGMSLPARNAFIYLLCFLQIQGGFLLAVGFFGVEDLLGDEFQPCRIVFLDRTIEAGLVPDMALAGIDLYFQDQAVLIAVNEDLPDLLDMTALLGDGSKQNDPEISVR